MRYASKFGAGLQNTLNAIRERKPFNAGNLTADEGGYGAGIMPKVWRDDYHETAQDVEYVIYSYSTPIAWFVHGEWVYPDVRYSNSSTSHQSTVRRALGIGYRGVSLDGVPVRITTLASIRRAEEMFA